MSESAQNLLRRIEAIDTAAAENRQRSESYRQMAEELKDVEGRATSPDGVVTVVAGPSGAVSSIAFSDQVRSTPPDVLAATVMHTLAEARASAARLQAEVIRRGLGDTELLDRVLDSDQQLFGDQRPRDPGPAPAVVRRRPEPVHEDDFYEGFNVFGGGPAR